MKSGRILLTWAFVVVCLFFSFTYLTPKILIYIIPFSILSLWLIIKCGFKIASGHESSQ